MTEETENLILRLLRDIRAEAADTQRDVPRVVERMTTLERKMHDVNESVAVAPGFAAHANLAYETSGKRLDRLAERVEMLEARIKELETAP